MWLSFAGLVSWQAVHFVNLNVARAALCEPRSVDFAAGTTLCEPRSAGYMAGTTLCDAQIS